MRQAGRRKNGGNRAPHAAPCPPCIPSDSGCFPAGFPYICRGRIGCRRPGTFRRMPGGRSAGKGEGERATSGTHCKRHYILSVIPMKRFRTVRSVLSALFLPLLAAGLVACGDGDTPGDNADTTAVVADSPAVASDAAAVAELDRMVNGYVVAADSLSSLFLRLKTVEEANAAEAKIQEWSRALAKFHAQSARYGQPLVDRMGAAGADSMLTRLINARETLEKNGPVYQRVMEIEAKVAPPPPPPSAH